MPQLFPNLGFELLDGELRLKNSSNTFAPVFLQGEHLCSDVVLPALAVVVDNVDVLLCVGEVLLERAQLALELVISEQPGVLAPAVEKVEVLAAGLEVGVGDVGFCEDGTQGVERGAGGGGLLGFVAREVERLEGRRGCDAVELGLDGGGEGRGLVGGRDGGGGGGCFGGYEGACGGESFR